MFQQGWGVIGAVPLFHVSRVSVFFVVVVVAVGFPCFSSVPFVFCVVLDLSLLPSPGFPCSCPCRIDTIVCCRVGIVRISC